MGVPAPDLAALITALGQVAPQLDADANADGAGIRLLRDHGIMSYLVPAEHGGHGGTLSGLLAIAEQLGTQCVGLAVLWVMHCQQVAIMAEYGPEPLRGEVLRAVADKQLLLGSITTETGKGGHVMTALAALDEAEGTVRFQREAPVCSGGAHADAYLITMRRSEQTAADDVVLVYAPRSHTDVTVLGPLDMLGMRGTSNVALRVAVNVPSDHLIDPPGGFPRIATRTMAPLAHLGWSAAWIGAARAGLCFVVRETRGADGRIRSGDDVLDRIAQARRCIDTAEAVVVAALREYERRSGADLDHPAFQILVNNVKVVASQQTYTAAEELMEIAGLTLGYLRGPDLPLERIHRDLRSASLMYSNQRLIRASGKLALLDAQARSLRATGLAAAG